MQLVSSSRLNRKVKLGDIFHEFIQPRERKCYITGAYFRNRDSALKA